MRLKITVLLGMASLLTARAGENVLIIGDSLSKEYEYEGPGIGIDTFPRPSPYPQNWCEILDDRRHDFFDFGDSDFHSDERLLGHDYNWSIPGSFAEEWHNDYLADPPSSLVSQLSQPQVKRIVIWLGGNDVRANYGPLYKGELSPAAWAAETYAHLAFVLDWVLARRQPDVQVVLVNVAHLGATPSKNEDHPYDPVLTGHVTAALDDLNAQLSALARAREVGFADIYRMTKELVTAQQMSIGGWLIYKRSSGDGDTDAMFLDDGFHPNMPVQALFAQTILDAFNSRYGTLLPRLTNREIVEKSLEESPEFTFTQWVTSYGVPEPERGGLADPDKDGVPNIAEFGLDLDPMHVDSHLQPQPRITAQALSLTWQPRDPTNTTRCEITAQQSIDLTAWTDVPAAGITTGSPNTKTASVPAGSEPVWLRLKVRQLAP